MISSRRLSGARIRAVSLLVFMFGAFPLLTAASCSQQIQSDLANASTDVSDFIADATAVSSEVASGVLAIADNACASAQPVLTAAQAAGVNPNSKSSVAGQLLAYATAVCNVSTGQIQPSALTNVNANFAYWLGNIVSGLQAAVNLTVPATSAPVASALPTLSRTGTSEWRLQMPSGHVFVVGPEARAADGTGRG